MKCTTCKNREAIIDLASSAQHVCKTCFTRIMRRRITKTVRENKLIEDGDKIAVAISGGKDSCLLLHWLAKSKADIIAIHVYRGDAFAVKSLKACEKMCEEAGVELHVASFSKDLGITFLDMVNITKKTGSNRCTVCGVFRRRILNSVAKKLGCNKLATGHNLTDEAQTYLMNFIRNDMAGFSHLGAISLPQREGLIQRIKPLRDVPDGDIKHYVDSKGWSYFPEPCPCRVGSMRHNMLAVMDLLEKARPSIQFSLVKSGDWIRKRSLNQDAATKLNACKKCKEPCAKELCKVCELLNLL